MKTFIAAALMLAPSLVPGQTAIDGYNRYLREQERHEQETELRKLQIERMRSGRAADPEIDRQLRDADARRAAATCYKETYIINGRTMVCNVCPDRRTTTCDE